MPYSNGHIQAVGTDARARRQYLYHPDWRVKRDLAKHDRVLAMARRLPGARERAELDLSRDGMPIERALATAFRLLDLGYFRIASDTYTDENGSYGLTTLERNHVHRLVFDFLAKSGKTQHIEVADAQSSLALTLCVDVEAARRPCSPIVMGEGGAASWRQRSTPT
jgi:DNA topoisomerase-1